MEYRHEGESFDSPFPFSAYSGGVPMPEKPRGAVPIKLLFFEVKIF